MHIANALHKLLNILYYPELLNTLRKNINRQFVKELLFIKNNLSITPNTIIDVGAGVGEYIKSARYVFPDAMIYAFEPIPASFNQLANYFYNYKNISIYNYALSCENKISKFYLNEFPFSSSLLAMTERHKEIFPHTKNEIIIDIECRRFDSLTNIVIKKPVLLKVDVQGAELEVLKGGEGLIKDFELVRLEVMFEPFYELQPQYAEIVSYMWHLGFKSFLQMDPNFSLCNTNRPIFCDLLFIK
jgi:FkbM family methyltransferase